MGRRCQKLGSLQGCVRDLQGEKYGVPNNDALQNLLVSFKDQPGMDYFAAGPRRSQFRDVAEQLKASYKAVKSQRDKQWKKEYNAQKLALLVFLIRREELERKPAAVAASVTTRGAKKGWGKTAEDDRSLPCSHQIQEGVQALPC